MSDIVTTYLVEMTLNCGETHIIYTTEKGVKQLRANNEHLCDFKQRANRLCVIEGYAVLPTSVEGMMMQGGLMEECYIQVDVAEIAAMTVTKKSQIQWEKATNG